MQAEARLLQPGVRQTVFRSHVDHQLVWEGRLGGSSDQTFPEPVAAPCLLGPALLHRGERGGPCQHEAWSSTYMYIRSETAYFKLKKIINNVRAFSICKDFYLSPTLFAPQTETSYLVLCVSVCFFPQLFEGMKAFRGNDNKIRLFRPMLNMERMHRSSDRSCLPVSSYPNSSSETLTPHQWGLSVGFCCVWF